MENLCYTTVVVSSQPMSRSWRHLCYMEVEIAAHRCPSYNFSSQLERGMPSSPITQMWPEFPLPEHQPGYREDSVFAFCVTQEPFVGFVVTGLCSEQFWFSYHPHYRAEHYVANGLRALDRVWRNGSVTRQVHRDNKSKHCATPVSPNPDTRDSTEVGRSDLSLCTLVLTIPRSQICHSLDGEIWEVLWGHCAIFGHNTSESDIGRWTFEAREIHRWGNLWGNREIVSQRWVATRRLMWSCHGSSTLLTQILFKLPQFPSHTCCSLIE